MFRKKPTSASKQHTEASSAISRDTSTKKIQDRALKPLDKNINISTELPRKSSLSKGGLKDLEQSQKRAIRLFYSKKYEEAFDMLQSCLQQVDRLQSVEHKVYIHYLYTEFYFKLGQYQQGQEHYHLSKAAYCSSSQQKKLTAYIINLECLHLSLMYELGQFEEMLTLSEDLTDKLEMESQQWFQCMWSRLKALFELDRTEEAECIGRVLIQKATKVGYQIKYTLKTAACLEKRGLHSKAMILLENGVRDKDGKQYNPLYRRIAELSLMIGDIIKAIYCLEKIKRSHAEDTSQNQYKESCKALARLYSQAGDDKKCVQNCEEIIEQAESQDYLLLGDSLAHLNSKKEAIKVYQKVLSTDFKQSTRLTVFMRMLPLLQCSELQSYEQQFLTSAQNFASGESVVALTQYANNIRKRGNYSRAQYFYKQAATLSSGIQLPQYTFVIFCNLGQMLEDLQKKTESSMYYTKALKLNVEHELTASISKRVNVMRG